VKTFNFAVPTLHVDAITPKQLMSGQVQQLIAARNAAAVAGEVRVAIAATVDYPSLIDAAKTVDALYELAEQVKAANEGQIPADLAVLFERKATAIRAAQSSQNAQPVAPAEPVQTDDLDELWAQILEASPWDDAEELERNFCELVKKPSDEASADDMRRFLAAMEKAKAGASS
jgi:hypothetical protein